MSDCLDIEMVTGFDWDDGNVYKNKDKHGLDYWIIEEIFFNNPLLIHQDVKHSEQECRCYALGCSDNGEKLFVVFTLRERKIRVISARLMNKKERTIYENA